DRSVGAGAARPLVAMAARHQVPAGGVALDLPLAACLGHDRRRARRVGGTIIRRQRRRLLAGVGRLRAEGFTATHRLRSASEVLNARAVLAPISACNRPEEPGPFGTLGAVHRSPL